MQRNLTAEGDNGVRDRTTLDALDNFRDRFLPHVTTDPADPLFPAVLVVLAGDGQGNSGPNNDQIVGVRGIGGAAPGVVGKGGASGGAPGVVGMGGDRRGTGVMGLTDGVPYPGNKPHVGVYGESAGDASIGVLGINKDGHGVVGEGGATQGAGVFGVTGGVKVVPSIVQQTGVYGEADGRESVGVQGKGKTGVRGVGSSVGVHGQGERGSVFESLKLAQVRLVPLEMDTPTGVLPGEFGDLLATRVAGPIGDRKHLCKLWFCVFGGPPGTAAWTQIA